MKKAIVYITVTAVIIVIIAIAAVFYVKSAPQKPAGEIRITPEATGARIKERGEDFFREKTYAPLISVYLKLLEKNPESLALKEKLAFAYFGAARYKEAKPLLEEIARAGSPTAEVYYKLGFIEQRDGSPDTAKKYLAEALRLNPDHAGVKEILEKMK